MWAVSMSAKRSGQAAPGAFDQPVSAARTNKTCGIVGTDDAPARADRFLRQREVLPLSGFGSSSTLKNKVKAGEFPAPIKISEGRQAWSEREVIAWQQEKIANRDATLSSATEEGAPEAAPARP
jgi:predicted DNA-binding transcriptional regulator AlpA